MSKPVRPRPRAFAELLALSPTTAARAELAAAGVAQHRIDALYPQSFAELVPGLKRHLLIQGASNIYERATPNRLAGWKERAEHSLWADEYARYLREMKGERAVIELCHYFRLWEESPTDGEDRLIYVAVLWSGWWFMTNYESLAEPAQRAGDRLIVEASSLWKLPKVKVQG